MAALLPQGAIATRPPDATIACEILVVGGGLAGVATAYEGLLAGRTVCLTELTDWMGGQISSQGTSALDERTTQRLEQFYSRGYLELRDRIRRHYGRINPGDCWVSESCFYPFDGHDLLVDMLEDAEQEGRGTLHWFPNTVIKDLDIRDRQIRSAIAIQHQPAPDAPPLNTFHLSNILEDAYTYADSERFTKTILQFEPLIPEGESDRVADWYVVEATETGELIALADLPHQLGIDALSYEEPSSSSPTDDPYCTQGFTYTFAMQSTEEPQVQEPPDFYPQYEPYYSYELTRLADFDLVFTYRRILAQDPQPQGTDRSIYDYEVAVGDISMQNWTWGNDYRPGTAEDNLIYTQDQLRSLGQLEPGGWLGGLRVETLRRGEEISLGYFHWLVDGVTDSQLGDGVKERHPNHTFLSGLDSPMGTVHGLSKYPYMREGRRIIGRPDGRYPDGFVISEIDISRIDYAADPFYAENLPDAMYRRLLTALAGRNTLAVLTGDLSLENLSRRSRSRIFPDSVGIGHYAIDFHPCMALHPPEAPGNIERPGERQGAGQAYPFQIPLRALIPQNLDNLLVAGKSIATSHIAAAAYRVHSFEWSSGVAVGNTIDVVLDRNLLPYDLVDNLLAGEPDLERLQQRLREQGNPIAFPDTSIFNEDWDGWR
ncbi:FAD-dependent oxidoreductase [Leptolyngbya sp. CCY15150]|uniref:FAD-dependent oxidoreductase n=1 Tax=Leptolyngbya sp. CCY15150 TaxID=2767772 RepID=UPI00194DFB87